ncbi:hypothetical protein TSUD_102140 [Trifolium subterraneum]|uniref:RNase H type-1 domain-containing protein n=1 Tax=Trifolium subterraneum TaxID=3900 RepID=A0A2Z6NBD8_TRISU|nr:hypothetical protein TSUD_102140 [Trifolium subterraneum]
MAMWLLHPDCLNVVRDFWNTTVIGCPMFVLSKKLKFLKEKLKIWNKEVFGNVHDQIKIAEEKVNSIQYVINSNGHSDSLMDLEKQAQFELELALNMEEAFRKEKTKVKWCLDGDRNTKYFHRVTKIKNATKLMAALRNGDNLLTNADDISTHVVQHYTILFNSSTVLQDDGLIEELIPNLISDDTNKMLSMLPSHIEIENVVFNLNKNGAPGPDGFGGIFFQTFWDLVKEDVIKAVLEFFTSSWLLPNFNSNSMVLIPKTANADSVENYRPIALANFKFKIISKIMADKLAIIMPNIVSKEQRVRLNIISNRLVFGIGSLPFLYLGVPIFRGKPKSRHLSPIADKVKLKLSAWKASLLSIAGRVQLVKSVIYARSLMVWRLLHHKLPTDDKLMMRGCLMPSVCNLCFCCSETIEHLFFYCPFALSIWNWFSSLINLHFTITSTDEPWNLCNRGWGPQCKIVITAAIINIINVIWYNKNQCRFNNAKPNLRSTITMIVASTSISGNATNLYTSSAMSDFCVLKAFKCNTDGATLGCPGQAASAGVFRDNNAIFLGGFTINLGINTTFHAELIGVMYAIEIAFEKGWWNLWVETDSMLVTLPSKSPSMVPGFLRNRRLNCMHLSRNMNFIISHIFREGNSLADKLASMALSLNGFMWHSHLPGEAMLAYNQNRFGFPLFRFSYS